ncbi:MAG: type II toxin-antitoxin system HicB family antitoxin [Lachnospiraceae bacterium]|nr:type II toxin-antitoxin system HicB family antitoxin [Lachnospiraceae bacterium]
MSKKDDLLKKEFYNLMNSMLEYNGYHATVTYDADDNLFVGEVFGISDSLNFHGSSIDELKKMFANCIDNYLDLCKQVGKEPQKEFKGNFNVRIPSELHKQIAMSAAQQKITLNQYVINALRKSI